MSESGREWMKGKMERVKGDKEGENGERGRGRDRGGEWRDR